MILPVVKLGTLVLKTVCKPIANRLKKEAGLHPKFRQLIINLAQVAGAGLIFEVQRSARSEARKEEIRRREIEAMKQKEEELAREVEQLKQKLSKIERLAKGRGLLGILNFRHGHALEGIKSSE
ncbi:Optic atrophy 3 protein (OPA3) [Musa troglodytarum]|uniref:Optic atrophy 3 protein (OPA3) n=1 Tax=Musa troglodytarum TaxID=320322 RepID=A0A9E7EZG3_9LILI|nr:Optic atrophy 3 protein (OPA3) [Musa troglodytarum]